MVAMFASDVAHASHTRGDLLSQASKFLSKAKQARATVSAGQLTAGTLCVVSSLSHAVIWSQAGQRACVHAAYLPAGVPTCSTQVNSCQKGGLKPSSWETQTETHVHKTDLSRGGRAQGVKQAPIVKRVKAAMRAAVRSGEKQGQSQGSKALRRFARDPQLKAAAYV